MIEMLLVLFLWFVPSLIAYERRHHQRHAILALQIAGFFLIGIAAAAGVSVLGMLAAVISFFGALIWGLTAVKPPPAPQHEGSGGDPAPRP